MEQTVGKTLKSLREKAKLKIPEVVERLAQNGFTVSARTLYGYENDSRMPNADIFITLCEVYDVNNLIEAFKNIPKDDYSVPSDDEIKLVEKYRSLDSYGQEVVEMVIEGELRRCKSQAEERERYEKVIEKFKDLQEAVSETKKPEKGEESQTSKTG